MYEINPVSTRREIIQKILTFIPLVLIPGFVSTCSDTNDNQQTVPQTGGNCLANGTTVTISGNHGHVLTVPAADITAQAAKNYDISGSAGHSHTVSLTSSNFATLAGNTGVSVVSSVNGHSHVIVINCV